MSAKNGLSAIANDVIGDVQKESEAIILAAETEAKVTLKSAKEQADQIYRDIICQAKVKAGAEKRKIASVTEVEMRNRLLQTKEDVVDQAFEKAYVEIKNFAATEDYNDYLIKLIENSVEKMGKTDIVIQVNDKDYNWLTENLLKRLSKKWHQEIKLSDKTEDYLGGCIIQTADGKVIYDVTLDNRLKELKPILRVELAKILFGEAI